MTKSQLRKIYKEKREQLSEDEYASINQLILLQFQQLKLAGIRCIHLFLPMRERKEPDTWLIRDWLKANHPEIKIVFPQTDFKTLTMRSFADDDQLVLSTNNYGISEPVSGNEVDVKEIDLVLLPLLVFDKWGYRVGYGKGFYDRFCAECREDTIFVGVSMFEPVNKIDDVNEYDVQMDACIMPSHYGHWL
ncbi:5-formyltetrahydrofolate cyclo-ligase [Mucilaginibacter yixingensis]|uniref:5-formyltetrahydrofolate cyclo-ligase n=1 Tax=Mucilaginibacter yixingensis TaxID=1295612 RepID=A0A2T5JE52_9SPHI|nr:5-formyltetrahydrofolate cyclo-ligase [Mucilaginibacter yixingensis]PTR00057.1 5-formyltetrahydrofolate cyclo-ligase [Mucilaginibacter yixingensis]